MSPSPECLPPYSGGESRITQPVIRVPKVADLIRADWESPEFLEIHHDVCESLTRIIQLCLEGVADPFFQREVEIKHVDRFLPFAWKPMLKEIAVLFTISLWIGATRDRVLLQ